jgi:hypothetical protein
MVRFHFLFVNGVSTDLVAQDPHESADENSSSTYSLRRSGRTSSSAKQTPALRPKAIVPNKRDRSKAEETEDEAISEKGAEDDGVAVGYVVEEVAHEETISEPKADSHHPSDSIRAAVCHSSDSDEDGEDAESKDDVALRALEGCSLFGLGSGQGPHGKMASSKLSRYAAEQHAPPCHTPDNHLDCILT